MEDLKRSHDEALQAAEQARGAVEQSRMRLQTTLAERTKLMSQLEQAKMQEHVAASLRQVNELSAPGQHAQPLGGAGQDRGALRQRAGAGRARAASVEGRMLEVQKATLDVAGASRLDQIRASMSEGPAGRRGQLGGGRDRAGSAAGGAARGRARRAAGRAPRTGGLTQPAGGDSVSGPEYPRRATPARRGRRARGCAEPARPRNCRWAAAAPRTTWPRGRRPVGPSGSTDGRWARGRPGPRRTSTAASRSRSTC